MDPLPVFHSKFCLPPPPPNRSHSKPGMVARWHAVLGLTVTWGLAVHAALDMDVAFTVDPLCGQIGIAPDNITDSLPTTGYV